MVLGLSEEELADSRSLLSEVQQTILELNKMGNPAAASNITPAAASNITPAT